MSLSNFAGIYRAVSFAYGCGSDSNSPQALSVVAGPNASGAQTLTIQGGSIALSDGTVLFPLSTTAPIAIGTGAAYEIVTPSAVSNNVQSNTYGPTSNVTATFTNAHGAGERISSGTVGLQEAINYASLEGGGAVVIDALWVKYGGTQAMVNAATATIPAGVSIQDNRLAAFGVQSVILPLTLAEILGANATPVQVIPAPGAGAMIDVIDATLNLIYGSAAYAGGGAAQLSYGSGVTYPATATWAATDFTALSANQVHKVAGALAVTGSTNVLNKAVNYTNATAAFTGGTGGSGVLIVNYKVVSGLS